MIRATKFENSRRGRKKNRCHVFSFGNNNKSPLYFWNITKKAQRRAQNKTGRWTKTKVPAYRKTIKARHENPLVHTRTNN